jgi:hypothetical protein
MKKSLRLGLSTFLVILLIKYGIRPLWYHHGVWGFWLGIAPNALSALVFPAVWLGMREHRLVQRFTPMACQPLGPACLTALLVIGINETCQLHPVFGRTFDVYDLLFSAAGIFVGYRCFTRYNKPATSYKATIQEKMSNTLSPAAV